MLYGHPETSFHVDSIGLRRAELLEEQRGRRQGGQVTEETVRMTELARFIEGFLS
jgi:hypothetical protein